MRRFFAIGVVAAVVVGFAGCSTDGQPTLVPGEGQEFVTGDVAHFLADDAEAGQPLVSPFTLEAAERGEASATIDNALVDGRRTTISWSSGTPLPITGDGGLDLGPVHVEVDPSGITWGLDGSTATFVPGTYRAGAAVAVGASGLASTRDSVSFEADSQTVLNARGGVVVKVDPQTLKLTGPGKISVSGTLKVQDPDGTREASAVTFGPGPFEVTLTPGGATGVTLRSVLQGRVTVS